MLKDKGVKFILYGWIGFISENIIVSHNRDYIIDHLGGEKTYRNIYSFFSSAATLSILYGYFKYARNKGPLYWTTFSKNRLALSFGF